MEKENSIDKNIQDEDKTCAALCLSTVPSSVRADDSTTAKDKARCFVPLWGFVFRIMAFFGLLCSFAQRVNLSVAIVAMVNHTALADDVEMANATNTSSTDQCPRDPALERADGEFTWDRHQQAAALATFYYGSAVSQVCSKLVTTNWDSIHAARQF